MKQVTVECQHLSRRQRLEGLGVGGEQRVVSVECSDLPSELRREMSAVGLALGWEGKTLLREPPKQVCLEPFPVACNRFRLRSPPDEELKFLSIMLIPMMR